MGILADSLFSVLMGWVRALVNALWSLFSSENTTILEFLGKNWVMIAVVIIAAGLVIDWIIWLIRWQPYHLWAQRARRLLRIEEPEEEAEKKLRARPAVTKKRTSMYERPAEYESPAQTDDEWIDETDEREVFGRAQRVPDRELGAYPGMLYDRENPKAGMVSQGTQHFGVLSGEGPGAAEVNKRRDEIDEYRRMQEEAAQRAREEAARRAEEERIAREEAARRIEEERIAREEAARRMEEDEQTAAARMAQEQYERELEEYERQRAQYERDLAEYERQKAAYDAQMAVQTALQETTVIPAVRASRRRRASTAGYSDYVTGEDVGELPDAPAWPQMDTARMPAIGEEALQDEMEKKPGLFDRVADAIGPQDEEEIMGIRALPPRVDMHEAYKPAKTPQKDGRRRR